MTGRARIALLILCIALLVGIAVFLLRSTHPRWSGARPAPIPPERPRRAGALIVARHHHVAVHHPRPQDARDSQGPEWWVKFQTAEGKVGIRLPERGGPQQSLIGRDRGTADLLLSDPGISRRHARLELFGEQLSVEDLGSTNGTSVNGERLAPGRPRVLRPGDRLGLGSVSGIVGRD